MPHLQSIQVLRAVAALMVVLFHLSEGTFINGAAGVDLFFVISGVVMGTVGVAERPGRFLARRIIRIAPLYWLVTAIMCVGSLLGAYRHFSFDTVSIAKSLLFIPYFEATGHIWPLLVPGWTLNYEMFFYIVFAAGLVLRLPIALSVGAMLVFVIMGRLLPINSAPWQVWTSPLLLEFAVGLLIATWKPRLSWRCGLAMLVAGCLGLLAVEWLQVYDASIRLLTWGVPAALTVAGALAIERDGRWPQRWLWPLARVGDASYSVYLLHGFVIGVGTRVIAGHTLLGGIGICVAAVVAGLGSYWAFERPVGRFLARCLRINPSHSPASIALAAPPVRNAA